MLLRTENFNQRAFTLIELLVVISILALLISIILPALNNAKLSAKQVVCAAQMKQWSMATLAYTTQNNNALPPYADDCDTTSGGNALDPETYWYNRLTPYLTGESHGKWGMAYGNRRCPMGKDNWGEKAVWIGVYYGGYETAHAPFVYLNSWDGSNLTNETQPFRATTIQAPASYLMMLDVKRDHTFNFFGWPWDTDYDGDGMNDSNSGMTVPYNLAQPKIHRGGCNVALFDGHVEWIRYETFWHFENGYPTHQYWYNNNHP